MPATDPNKNSFHWRNNSGELDVFEAARYFSGAGETHDSSMFSPKLIGENRLHGHRAARMSLDIPMMRNIPITLEKNPTIQKLQLKENKKCKQPNSPGGRIASFLNSLFNQTESKKKLKLKLKLKDSNIVKEEGRKRRSSISHFRITPSNESTSSGVITPPADAKTPTKSSYGGFSDHQTAINSKEFRFKYGNFRNSTAIVDEEEEEDRGFRKFSDVDDGADTDSSSDLFDLPNYDLDLPVYGTTDMGTIRVGAPIPSM